jgi:hypothetical protein
MRIPIKAQLAGALRAGKTETNPGHCVACLFSEGQGIPARPR